MSNLLKSKFLLGVMVVAVMFVGVVAVATSASADCSITMTLRVGSTGLEVSCLQAKVGATADGSFGPLTKAAVMAWQAGHGLSADGVVGPMTRAALMGAPTGNFPAGCTSASGFSTTTGVACNTGPSAGLPAGCSSTSGFSPLTGASCSGSSTPTGPLSGGAGDLVLTDTHTDVEDSLKEGESDVKVLGFKAEADGSDVAVTSVKVTLDVSDSDMNEDDATASENINKYLDSVAIFMVDKQFGSADVSDFSKESGDTPDTYSKTISLSNAVVRDNSDEKFYVAVTANDSIDTDDVHNGELTAHVDVVRFNDATGAILSYDNGDLGDENDVTDQQFTFDDSSSDDQIDLRTSTSNPDDGTVQVEEDSNSDAFLALAFKLDVDADSQDVDVTTMTFDVDFSAGGSNADAPDDVINSVVVKIGGNEYEADLDDSESVNDGSGSASYTVDLDSGDLTIGSGDVAEGKVYVTFNDQGNDEGNYADGTEVTVSLDKTSIEAETVDDELDVTGSSTVTGAVLTARANGADFSFVSASRSTSGTDSQVATFTIKFTAESFGDDIYIPKSGEDAIDFDILYAGDDSVYATSGTSGVGVSLLSSSGADFDNFNSDSGADEFLVSDSESFTITVTMDNNEGFGDSDQYYLKVNGISFYPNEDDGLDSATTTDEFQTDPIAVGVTP